jgi:hypothetical protein
MGEIKNTPKHTDDEMVNKMRGAFEHRATWMGLMYDEARKRGIDLEEAGRAAISKTGTMHGQIVNESKPSDSMADFRDTFLNEMGQKMFEMEFKKTTDTELEVDFHYCPLVNAWKALGFDNATIETLCDMAMDGDRGIAAANGLEFELGDTIAKGCPTCQLVFKKK